MAPLDQVTDMGITWEMVTPMAIVMDNTWAIKKEWEILVPIVGRIITLMELQAIITLEEELM